MAPTSSTTSVDRRRTDTRAALVRTATGLFRRRGIGTVGVAEICERAGVTKGVFSHHFPGGKDELVAAVVAANGAEVRVALAQTVARDRPTATVVRSMFDGYAKAMRSRGCDFGCPVAAAVVDESARSNEHRDAAADAFGEWRQLLATRLPRAEADLTLAALEGAILLARADGDPAVVTRVGRALAALLEAKGE